MRHLIRFPLRWMLEVAILSIPSEQGSLVRMVRCAKRNYQALNERLGTHFGKLWPALESKVLQALYKLLNSNILLRTEVGAFYLTDLAPDIVNSMREEQGSISV